MGEKKRVKRHTSMEEQRERERESVPHTWPHKWLEKFGSFGHSTHTQTRINYHASYNWLKLGKEDFYGRRHRRRQRQQWRRRRRLGVAIVRTLIDRKNIKIRLWNKGVRCRLAEWIRSDFKFLTLSKTDATLIRPPIAFVQKDSR